MKQIAIEILEKIIPPTISALLATWVAVRLALNRYKKESLWARKLDAYTKILDCLHICRLNAEHQVDVYRIGTERSNEYQEKMRHKVSDAHSELAKVVDAGSLKKKKSNQGKRTGIMILQMNSGKLRRH
ncbi:hypothetical protein Ga0100231_008305 [Opitutaceae bacterium TAV4]|nr:hypothetical protein Ga0100231_008305 [Opitutaceae bacterium TAV4]RRJ98449.1 hypothetical protein Ga0100230_008590 [Opitutaceae bacterium TAV3]